MMNSVTIRQALEFIGLLSTSPSNPYNLCNTFGIEVIDNEPINKDGYLVCDRGCKLIFVSSNITNRHRKKFIISHELGHFLFLRSGYHKLIVIVRKTKPITSPRNIFCRRNNY